MVSTNVKRSFDLNNRDFQDLAKLEFRLKIEGADLNQKTKQLIQESKAEEIPLSQKFAELLVSRGISTVEELKKFLFPNLKNHLPDPSNLKNMPQAVEFLLEAVKAKKQITIFTDFDVDGLSAGAQLFIVLKKLNAKVNSYVPDRFTEGYGLSLVAIEKLHKLGTEVLVTVDCGINSIEEIKLANKYGISSLIIDHHLPQELPAANFIINPAQEGCPFKEYLLASAGIVWMLCIAIRTKLRQTSLENKLEGELSSDSAMESAIPDPKELLDLAVLGTVCDMVPLKSLNRLIVSRGLEVLRKSPRLGIKSLSHVSGIKQSSLTSGQLGYTLGPRINAAGRLAQAIDVFELLTTEDHSRAEIIAQSIDKLNSHRRSLEENCQLACIEIIQNSKLLKPSKEVFAYAIFKEDFHLGIIGIVAQRIVQRYGRPAAIMAPGEITLYGKKIPVIKGSVRSIKGFHVANALEKLSQHLVQHGGHAEAGGFTLKPENLKSFQEAFNLHAQQTLTQDDLRKKCFVDLEIDFDVISIDFYRQLEMLAPFGIGNPNPIFLSKNILVESVSSFSNKHLRLRLSQDKNPLANNAIAWNSYGNPFLRKGQVIDVAYQIEINTYQGVGSIQLNIVEVWPKDD